MVRADVEVMGDSSAWAKGSGWPMSFATRDVPTCEEKKAPKSRRNQIWVFEEFGCGGEERESRLPGLLTF